MSKKLPLLAAAFCAVVLLSAWPGWCPAAEKPSAEQKIEEELGRPTQLQFIETPLQDVVDFLKQQHHIEIQLDRKALDDVGLDPSTIPITKNLKGLSLRSALRLTLRDLDLTYLVGDEVLQITTPEEAKTRITTKFYPVADLVASGDRAEQDRRRDELLHAIATTVEPWSWDPVGGEGTIATTSFHGAPTLVVSQTYHVHRKIAAFLDEQRKVVQAGRLAAIPRCPVVDVEKTPAVKEIEKALTQPTEFRFVEETLQGVADHLKEKHKIDIQIDRKALDDVGLDATTIPVTKSCKQISLRSALRLLLRDLDLIYMIEDEVLLITTPEDGELRPTTRVYPVGDLWGSFRSTLGSPWFPRGEPLVGMPFVGVPAETAEPPEDPALPSVTEADSSPESVPEPTRVPIEDATLADMISWIVEPTNWEQEGGLGSISIGSVGGVDVLVVSQSQDVHEQIVDLLDMLREAIRCNRLTATPADKPTTKGTPKRAPAGEPAGEPPADRRDDPFAD